MSAAQIISRVANEGMRPPLPPGCPWNHVMEACWSEDPAERPDFEEIFAQLTRIYETVTGHELLPDGETFIKVNQRRRSQDDSDRLGLEDKANDDNDDKAETKKLKSDLDDDNNIIKHFPPSSQRNRFASSLEGMRRSLSDTAARRSRLLNNDSGSLGFASRVLRPIKPKRSTSRNGGAKSSDAIARHWPPSSSDNKTSEENPPGGGGERDRLLADDDHHHGPERGDGGGGGYNSPNE